MFARLNITENLRANGCTSYNNGNQTHPCPTASKRHLETLFEEHISVRSELLVNLRRSEHFTGEKKKKKKAMSEQNLLNVSGV